MRKIRQLEKKRFSLVTNNLEQCYICHKPKQDIHEIYEGARRKASMIYGCCLPVCRECHMRFHNDREFALQYKKIFQAEFEDAYPNKKFIDIFHKKYK